MATFATIRSRIADDINRSDLTSQINTAINRAISYYAKRYRFWFNETTATFNTVASQGSYTSTDTSITNIREIDYVKIAIQSNNNYELVPVTYKTLQDDNVSNHTGDPAEYAYYKENFFLYPVPNAAKTITVSYVKSYTDLSADADTNDFTEEAEDLIESHASAWVYARVLKDYDAATVSKAEEKEALAALMSETARMISTGRIVSTDF